MQSRFTLNYPLAKELAIQGIKNYLENKTVDDFTGRDGFFHGDLGRIRAKKALTYFLQINKEEEFLAGMIAIFGDLYNFSPYVYKRSSRLAGLIADQWFTGVYEIKIIAGHTREIKDTLSSPIVDINILHQSNSRSLTFITENIVYNIHSHFFHKTNGVRDLLNIALNHDFSPIKKNLLQLAKTLQKAFNSNTPQWVSKTGAFLWAKAATVGVLTNTDYYKAVEIEKKHIGINKELKFPNASATDMVYSYLTPQKFPLEIAENISLFFTLADSAKLMRVRKNAKESVDTIKKIYTEEFTLKRR